MTEKNMITAELSSPPPRCPRGSLSDIVSAYAMAAVSGHGLTKSTSPNQNESSSSSQVGFAASMLHTSSPETNRGGLVNTCPTPRCPRWSILFPTDDTSILQHERPAECCDSCGKELILLREFGTNKPVPLSSVGGAIVVNKRQADTMDESASDLGDQQPPAKKLKSNVSEYSCEKAQPETDIRRFDLSTGLLSATREPDIKVNKTDKKKLKKFKKYCLLCHSKDHENSQCREQIPANQAAEIDLWLEKNLGSIHSLWRQFRTYKGAEGGRRRDADEFHSSEPVTCVNLLDHLYYLAGNVWIDTAPFIVQRDSLLRSLESDEDLLQKVHGSSGSSSEAFLFWRKTCMRANSALELLQTEINRAVNHLVKEVIKNQAQRAVHPKSGYALHNKTDHLRICCSRLKSQDVKLTTKHRGKIKEFRASLDRIFNSYEADLETIEDHQLQSVADQELDRIQLRVLRLATSYLRLTRANDSSLVFPRFQAPAVLPMKYVVDGNFVFDQDQERQQPTQRGSTDDRLKSIPTEPRLDYGDFANKSAQERLPPALEFPSRRSSNDFLAHGQHCQTVEIRKQAEKRMTDTTVQNAAGTMNAEKTAMEVHEIICGSEQAKDTKGWNARGQDTLLRL